MSTLKSIVQAERGSTLIEMIIACFLTVIVGGAAMEFYISQHRAWLVENEVAEIQQNARASLDQIAAQVRLGGYQLRGHPSYKISPDSLIVYYRNDGTAEIDTTTYFVDAGDAAHPVLRRQYKGENAEILAEYIEHLTVSQVSSRVLEILLTARAAEPDSTLIHGDGYRRRTFSTQIRLRNS